MQVTKPLSEQVMNKLKAYIKNAKEKGYNDGIIKSTLLSKGYPDSIIKQIFRELGLSF